MAICVLNLKHAVKFSENTGGLKYRNIFDPLCKRFGEKSAGAIQTKLQLKFVVGMQLALKDLL